MDIWTFGLAVAFVGAGGTVVVLWLLSLVILLLRKTFPASAPPSKKG